MKTLELRPAKGQVAQKKKVLWLASNLLFLALFWIFRENRALMNAISLHVTRPLGRLLGRISALVPFSVMELLLGLLALGLLLSLILFLRRLLRSPAKGACALSFLLGLACLGLTLYSAACLLWGVNYYCDSFCDQSGIRPRESSVEELYAVTSAFAAHLNETANEVARDENGLFAVPRDEIFAKSTTVYTPLSEQLPFLAFADTTPKQVHFSKIMSVTNFTGVYCPFTGESNLNVDSPACLLPSTIAHELAHQRGIASEQECNFLAVLAATSCGDASYAYSGWLLGYIYLGNALYGADKALWEEVYATLPESTRLDLQANSAYWAQFESGVSRGVQTVYDRFLKGYGEEKGVQSYGTVVDLLVAYYL